MNCEKIPEEELKDLKQNYNDIMMSLEAKPERRDSFDRLSDFAVKNGFHTAPASTKYHLCTPGGLLKHSINVVQVATKLNEALDNPCDPDSLLLVALFHDLHKCTDGCGQAQYTPNEGRDSYYKPFNWNKEAFVMSGDFKSALIMQRFVTMTLEEIQAVAYHSGAFSNSWQDISGQAYPLTYLLHFSDMYSSFIVERDFNFENCKRVFKPEGE